jgi:GDP-D-mannose dehydratase
MIKEKVLVTGITGQDGLYMAAHLLLNEKDTEIHGIVRKNSRGL